MLGNKLERKNSARKALKQDISDKERQLKEERENADNMGKAHSDAIAAKEDELNKLKLMLEDLRKEADISSEDMSQKLAELARVNGLLEQKEKEHPELIEAHAMEMAGLNNRLEKKKASKAGLRRDLADRDKDLQAAKEALE